MIDHLFIKKKEDYKNINKLLYKILNIKKELPKYIFKKKYNKLKFIYDYESFSNEFWEIIKKFTILSNDDKTFMTVLKPHPEKYYNKYFGYYNYGVFPISCTFNEYNNFLNHSPQESPADSIICNSNYICWFSESLNWVIYLVREYELCILAYDDNNYDKIIESSNIYYFETIVDALDHNLAVLEKTKKKLIKNYNL